MACEEEKRLVEIRKKILDAIPEGTGTDTRKFLKKQYEDAKKKYDDCLNHGK